MKSKIQPKAARRLPSDTRLFLFTKDDEARIVLAKLGAAKFMAGYGKGSRPEPIDLSHYQGYIRRF